MKNYIITTDTAAHAHYLFNESCRVLKPKIKKVIKIRGIIELEDYVLRFIEEKSYERNVQYGNEATPISGWGYEKLLDLYRERKQTATEIYEWLKKHSGGVIAESLLNTFFKENYDVDVEV